jgi:DNA-binding transcriptional regulator YbjK
METSSQIKLIKAAAPLFAKKGFASVSIRELAEAAKVNGALISYYFSINILLRQFGFFYKTHGIIGRREYE